MPRFSNFRTAAAIVAAVLAGGLGPLSASAQDAAGAPYAHNDWARSDWQSPRPDAPPPATQPGLPAAPHGSVAGDDVAGRAEWLADCRRRLTDRDSWQDDLRDEWGYDRRHRRDRRPAPRGADECETYLDSYLAHARAVHAQQIEFYAAHQMAITSPRMANCEREVIEEIEEVVPARASPRRAPVRDKRIRIAPDKRVQTQ